MGFIGHVTQQFLRASQQTTQALDLTGNDRVPWGTVMGQRQGDPCAPSERIELTGFFFERTSLHLKRFFYQ